MTRSNIGHPVCGDRVVWQPTGNGGGVVTAFADTYAARTLNSRTVVLILSDGYDTGAPERLAEALSRLRKRGCRIIWLNPLKGWRDYEPVAAGIAAALVVNKLNNWMKRAS